MKQKPLTLTLASHFMVYSGYGTMAEYYALGMKQAGATVNIDAIIIDEAGLTPEFMELYKKSAVDLSDPVLYFLWPEPPLERYIDNPNLFMYTTWESNVAPDYWVESLNKATAVMTTTRFVAEAFRASGVEVPVHVVPQGIDPAIYPYIDRPRRNSITTLIVTTMIERKHWRQAIQAWQMAFEGDDTARLIIKGHFDDEPQRIFSDSRIEYINENQPSRGIARYYEQVDVLLQLGSEGFGLPLVEGMATGLPVVALSSEGQGDICEDAPGLVLPVDPIRTEPHNDPYFGSYGVHSIPNVEQAAEHLRWVADNQEAARELGKAASAWAHKHRNIWHAGPKLLEIIAAAL